MQQKKIPIRGMHCRSCELLLEESIGAVQGVQRVKVDFRRGRATIEHGADLPSENEIARAVKNAGYEVGEPGKLPWLTKDPADWKYLFTGAVVLILLFFAIRGTGLLEFSLDESNVTFGFALVLGLVAGLSTCMALVGGLVLGVAARHAELHPEATAWQKFRPHIFFNLGRVLGYALLGGLLGSLGGVLQISGGVLAWLMIVVGGVMLMLGIKLTNVSPRISAKSLSLPPSIARTLGLSQHGKAYSHRTSLVTGALTFFLPCGFTQAMQLFAISTGDFSSAALVMGAFALGTSPALLGIGGLSSIMKGATARQFYALVGILVIVFGLYNIQSGARVLPLSAAPDQGPVVEDTQPLPGGSKDVQIIQMRQTGSGYSPSTLRVKAGIPVRWVITSESQFTCAASFSVPALRVNTNLKKGKNIIEFTPKSKGSIPFSCSMGMYRGTIIVE